jgi:hypothetical protein
LPVVEQRELEAPERQQRVHRVRRQRVLVVAGHRTARRHRSENRVEEAGLLRLHALKQPRVVLAEIGLGIAHPLAAHHQAAVGADPPAEADGIVREAELPDRHTRGDAFELRGVLGNDIDHR